MKDVDWIADTAPVPYERALAFMDARVEAIRAGRENECVWLLEHPPLYTAGTSARPEHLLEKRFPVHAAGRGGQYTYHGPGQRVAYVMLDLRRRGPDLRAYVLGLESWIIAALADMGVTGHRRAGRVGVWVELPGGAEAKIAALGVRLRKWVTLHGVSVNLCPDLSHYGAIVPCGITGYGVTSLSALGVEADMGALDAALRRAFQVVF